MNKREWTKLVHEGNYVAAVNVELLEEPEGWSPYLSLEDAYRLDDVREALRRGDIKTAARYSRVFSLTPVGCRPLPSRLGRHQRQRPKPIRRGLLLPLAGGRRVPRRKEDAAAQVAGRRQGAGSAGLRPWSRFPSAEPAPVLPAKERHPVPRHGAGSQKRTKPNQKRKP